jgi:type II secretory pathway predicted ATPase ExeA
MAAVGQLRTSETPTFKLAVAHVRKAIEYRQLATIIGDPGTGKSHLARAFAESDPNCILMTIDVPELKSWPEFVRRLASASNAYRHELNHLSTHHVYSRIQEEFKNTWEWKTTSQGPWLLIDEAQRLSFPILRAAIDLQDSYSGPQMPVVLNANRQFLGHKRDRDFPLEQISSRTEPRTLYIEVSWRDYQQLAIDNDVQGANAYSFLEARFERSSELRDLTALLSNARIILPQGPLTLGILELAQTQMGNIGQRPQDYKVSKRHTAA